VVGVDLQGAPQASLRPNPIPLPEKQNGAKSDLRVRAAVHRERPQRRRLGLRTRFLMRYRALRRLRAPARTSDQPRYRRIRLVGVALTQYSPAGNVDVVAFQETIPVPMFRTRPGPDITGASPQRAKASGASLFRGQLRLPVEHHCKGLLRGLFYWDCDKEPSAVAGRVRLREPGCGCPKE